MRFYKHVLNIYQLLFKKNIDNLIFFEIILFNIKINQKFKIYYFHLFYIFRSILL